MPTTARSTFDLNALRASYFLDIHEAGHARVGAPLNPYRELPRGAVVFAVGAVDAYLSEVSAEVLLNQLEREVATPEARDVLRRVHADLPGLALEVAVLPAHEARVRRVRESITDYFYNRVSNFGSKALAATVTRIGGRPADLWAALAARGQPNASGNFDRWTEIRHQIVHQGRSPQVRRPEARACIELVRAIVHQVDSDAVRAIEGAFQPDLPHNQRVQRTHSRVTPVAGRAQPARRAARR
jgi:hypothetical protein